MSLLKLNVATGVSDCAGIQSGNRVIIQGLHEKINECVASWKETSDREASLVYRLSDRDKKKLLKKLTDEILNIPVSN
jgi:hypothetical protein